MELKKSNKADIERHKSSFFGTGLVIALSLSLIAFEWSTPPKEGSDITFKGEQVLDTEIIPQTIQEEKQEAEPPAVPPDIINIVDNNIPDVPDIKIWEDYIKESDSIPQLVFTDEPDVPEDEIFINVSDMPEFQGGNLNRFSTWVMKNVKYPAHAVELGIQEKIILSFVVEKDGSVSNVTLLRGTDQSLINEAKRVVQDSPKWKPGYQQGLPARVAFSIVVNFKLQQ